MSWDIVLFNSPEKIDDFESFNPDNLVPIDFGQAFEEFFKDIKKTHDAWEITGKDFTIVHYPDDKPATNCLINLYGENAIYAIVYLARIKRWQVFDTGIGGMLDLHNPSNNGYKNFQDYLRHVTRQ